MADYIAELLWGKQYSGLSAYLPVPIADITSITLCYDIGTILLVGLIILVHNIVNRPHFNSF